MANWRLGLIFTLFIIQSKGYDVDKLRELFKDDECIEGKIVVIETHPVILKTGENAEIIQDSATDPISVTNNNELLVKITKAVEVGKNPLILLNELAQFHNIPIEYLLINEEGPSHERIFYVKLKLGDEVYLGREKSLKKAKLDATVKALANTKYDKPPTKVSSAEESSLTQTPTVLLNNLVTKLGLKAEYINENNNPNIIDENIYDISTHNFYSLDSTTKGYIEKLNDSVKAKVRNRAKVTEIVNHDKSPFKIRLVVGDKTYFGGGWSLQAARHDAADKALKVLNKLTAEEAENCLRQGVLCNKFSAKSPVSLVFETGATRNLPVAFEIVEENGPSHKKEFVTMCKVGDFKTLGEGPSKKASKKKAAEKMLVELEKIEPITNKFNINSNSKKKLKKRNKAKVKRPGMLDNVASVLNSITGNVEEFETYDDGGEDHDNRAGGDNKRELLDLARTIDVQIQILNDMKDNKHHSIVSINTDPAYMCFNEDVSKDLSEENAALSALKFLKLNLDNIVIPLHGQKGAKPKLVVETVLREGLPEKKL